MRLPGSDTIALDQLAWRLSAISSRDRSNLIALAGLAHAYILRGHRDRASEIVDELWGRRGSFDPYLRLQVANHEADLGNYERSIELAHVSDDGLPPFLVMQRNQVLLEAVVSAWVPNAAELLSQTAAGPGYAPWREMASQLSNIGLLDLMPLRQQLVRTFLLPVQSGSELAIDLDGDGNIILAKTIYVASDYEARRRLSDELADALSEFYRQHGIDEGAARNTLSEIILPVTAREAAIGFSDADAA